MSLFQNILLYRVFKNLVISRLDFYIFCNEKNCYWLYLWLNLLPINKLGTITEELSIQLLWSCSRFSTSSWVWFGKWRGQSWGKLRFLEKTCGLSSLAQKICSRSNQCTHALAMRRMIFNYVFRVYLRMFWTSSCAPNKSQGQRGHACRAQASLRMTRS